MGLDMYLDAKLYVSEYFEPEIHEKISNLGIDYPTAGNAFSSFEVSFKAMYWRKANQIHDWFVQNVQGGVDECQKSTVSIEDLTELRDLCRCLLTSKNPEQAKEELPTTAGFFFGSTEYDEDYWSDLEETAAGLDKILAHPKLNAFDFSYCASW